MLLSVEAGEGPIRVDGHDWRVGPGDVLVLAPGAVMSVPGPELDPAATAWTVSFPADAVRALLTLLLVRLGRLEVDVPHALADDPLIAAVFEIVERRSTEAISAREVAAEMGLTPGHLTTVVSRRTGRSLGRWITERRLREARMLLADTDLTVAAVARRVGYADPGYFVRRFRRDHGLPPQAWRTA